MLESLISAISILRANQSNWKLQCILIDNSELPSLELSDFESYRSLLDSFECELRLIQGQGNVGYGAGQNLGLDNSKAEFFLIMNPDVTLDPESLRIGMDYLQENPDVAIVAPAATDESGSKQFLCKRYPSLLVLLVRGFSPRFMKSLFTNKLASYAMHDLDENKPSKEIPIVSGCFMLCRTVALNHVAGFNEDYFLYFEDFDLSMRLSENYTLAYLPAMQIVHGGGKTAKKGFKHISMFLKSAYRFYNTYGWRLF